MNRRTNPYSTMLFCAIIIGYNIPADLYYIVIIDIVPTSKHNAVALITFINVELHDVVALITFINVELHDAVAVITFINV